MAEYQVNGLTIEAVSVNRALHCAARDWYALPQWLIDAYESPRDEVGVLFAADAVHILKPGGGVQAVAYRGDWLTFIDGSIGILPSLLAAVVLGAPTS